MNDEKLRKYLIDQLNQRNWSYRRFAKEIDMSHTKIAQFISGQQKAGDEFCRKVSDFFNIPIEEVWSMAGIVPSHKVSSDELSVKELTEIGRKLSHQRRFDLLSIAQILLKQESNDSGNSSNSDANGKSKS